MPKLMSPESVTYYSKNRMSFTGRNNAGMNCFKGSSWKMMWNPLSRSVKEFLLQAGTDPELCNREEIEKWIEDCSR